MGAFVMSSDPAHKLSSAVIDEARYSHASEVSGEFSEGFFGVEEDIADSDVAGPVELPESLQEAIREAVMARAAPTRPTLRAVEVVVAFKRVRTLRSRSMWSDWRSSR